MVGASCVNAVSSIFNILVTHKDDTNLYELKCEKGIVKQHVKIISNKESKKSSGTTVSFILDKDIWKDEEIDYKKLRNRIKQISYLTNHLTLTYTCKQDNIEEVFGPYQQNSGLDEYIKELTKQSDNICSPILLDKTEKDVRANIAFLYTSAYKTDYYTFVNNVETARAGDHLNGFRAGISSAIFKYIKDNNVKNCKDLNTEDTLEGITAIISVKVKDPKFEGQGKTSIKMPVLKTVVQDIVSDALYEYLSKNNDTAKAIIDKLISAAKARIAAKRAREAARTSNSKLNSITLADKFAACSTKDPDKIEIYLVEGKMQSCPL